MLDGAPRPGNASSAPERPGGNRGERRGDPAPGPDRPPDARGRRLSCASRRRSPAISARFSSLECHLARHAGRRELRPRSYWLRWGLLLASVLVLGNASRIISAGIWLQRRRRSRKPVAPPALPHAFGPRFSGARDQGREAAGATIAAIRVEARVGERVETSAVHPRDAVNAPAGAAPAQVTQVAGPVPRQSARTPPLPPDRPRRTRSAMPRHL